MNGKSLLTSALIAFTAGSASGEPTPPNTPSTIQQRFDAGGAAIDQRDWQKAYDIYSALESDLSAKRPDYQSLPIIRLRKGRAMEALGRLDEAEPVIVAALGALPSAPDLADDRYHAWMALADIADIHFNYPLAVERWHQAADSASHDTLRLSALLKAAPLAIFVDPAVALRDLDTAQSLVQTLKPKSPEWSGLIHNYRGRTLMNTGEIKAARRELEQSVELLGGLSTSNVNRLDTTARSDAAIAAFLDESPAKARELLAYAGGAVVADQGFSRAQDASPPTCDIPGLTPPDVAVVQFMILDDGSVAGVRPIYFSGQRALAVEFARAVARWSWSTEKLKELKPFFRAQTRIELRCTNRFKQHNGAAFLTPAVDRWLKQSSFAASEVPVELPAAVRLRALRAELIQRQAGGAVRRVTLPTLVALALNAVIPPIEGAAFAREAYDLAMENGALGEVKAWFLLSHLRFDSTQWQGKSTGRYQLELGKALTDRTFTDDARAEAALRLALFDSLNAKSRSKDGKAVLEPLLASGRLEKADPFRVGALIRMSNLEYVAGNVESARERFEQSGITAQQCALVDARPARTRSGSATEFPEEALNWGLGGWAVTEFDISPEGLPLNVRTVAASPPFLFAHAAESNIRSQRYQQTYRPGSGQGCVSNNVGVRFDAGR